MSDARPPRWLAGRYELETRIGGGGMAEVWRAWRTKADGSKERVAVKRVLPLHTHKAEASERLDREAKICETLSHANLIKVLDYIEDEEGERWLVMEYIEGATLGELCADDLDADERLSYEQLRAILVGVLQGLAYLHRNGIVHRDISDGNIMISRVGEVKLTDMGFAKRIGQPRSRLSVGPLIGTVPYMCPEAFDEKELDASSDLYSLAAVIFFAVSGRGPFPGDNPSMVAFSQQFGERVAAPEGLPKDFAQLFDGLLVSRRRRRFRTAQALLEFAADSWGPSFPEPPLVLELSALVDKARARRASSAVHTRTTVSRRITFQDSSPPGSSPLVWVTARELEGRDTDQQDSNRRAPSRSLKRVSGWRVTPGEVGRVMLSVLEFGFAPRLTVPQSGPAGSPPLVVLTPRQWERTSAKNRTTEAHKARAEVIFPGSETVYVSSATGDPYAARQPEAVRPNAGGRGAGGRMSPRLVRWVALATLALGIAVTATWCVSQHLNSSDEYEQFYHYTGASYR